MEGVGMPAIVEFPTIVQQVVKEFGVVFTNETERRHFAEYLSGLFVAERKSVSGINSEFAVTTDQSCLNRWITDVDWDELDLNKRRLEWLQRDPSTRYSAQGVIAVDDTLNRPLGHTHRGRRLVLGPRRQAPPDRPRLPHRQLRLHVGQALCARVLTLFRERDDCERALRN
jgi:hypothetical protein